MVKPQKVFISLLQHLRAFSSTMMKRSEKNLLRNLRGTTTATSEAPLVNIKNSLGSLRYAVGNPLSKNEIRIEVDIFFCNNTVDPTVLIPFAALPAQLQQNLPFYLFGLNDMYGFYRNVKHTVRLHPNWAFQGAGFWNYNLFANAWTIPAFLFQIALDESNDGDYLIFYINNVVGLNDIRAMVRIRCNNVSYSTLVHSLMSDIIYLDAVRSIVANADILQYTNPLIFSSLSTFGKVVTDSIDPRMYIRPTEPQEAISDIPVKIPIDKRIAISTQMQGAVQHIVYIFFVQSIDVLTNKKQ